MEEVEKCFRETTGNTSLFCIEETGQDLKCTNCKFFEQDKHNIGICKHPDMYMPAWKTFMMKLPYPDSPACGGNRHSISIGLLSPKLLEDALKAKAKFKAEMVAGNET